MSRVLTRQQRHRALISFFIVNVVFFSVLSLIYLRVFPSIEQLPLVTKTGFSVAVVFAGLAFLTQAIFFSLGLTLVCYGLLLLPWVWGVGLLGCVSGVVLYFFFADAWIFMHYRLHLVGLVWDIYASGVGNEVLDFTWVEWLRLLSPVLIFVGVELLAIAWIVRRVLKGEAKKRNLPILLAVLFSVPLLSYVIFMKAAFSSLQYNARVKSNGHLVVMVAQLVPYFEGFLGTILPIKNSMHLLETAHETFYVQNQRVKRPLQYPLHPLRVEKPKSLLNVVVIGIDTWRFDQMNAQVTPNINAFSRHQIRFLDHYSGGNSTLPGLFSFFYSIPSTYWSAVLSEKRRPAFFDRLQALHYDIKILASASLEYPNLAGTFFKDIPGLRIDTPGEHTYQRDQRITQDFVAYLKKQKKPRPLFAFLFYDSVHNWCAGSQPYKKPFQPAITLCDRLSLSNGMDTTPLLHRYQNALHFVDAEVGKVLRALKKQNMLKNTIVIITADHGEEFNDTKQSHWFHASAYDRFQTRVPLIVHWPGKRARIVAYKTQHYDVIPTLMRGVYGVNNAFFDYSVGRSLFTNNSPSVLLVSNYRGYALVSDHRITTFYPGGRYRITDTDEKPVPAAALDLKQLRYAYELMTRFFKRSGGQDDKSST